MKGEELLPRNGISSINDRQDILAPRQGTTDVQIPEEFDGEGLLDNHPFFEGIDTHLLKTCAMLKASTIGEKRRKLQHIGRVFEDLQRRNPTFTSDPAKLTETEVTAFINWMRENGIQPETQRKYLQMLRDYCLFCDNSVVHKMKIIYKSSWPKAQKKDIKALSTHEVNHIIQSVQDWKGWWGDVARFVTVMYPHTGLRPSEMREMLVDDVHVDELYIKVSNPKGDGIYGEQREIEIDEYYKETVVDFLEARERFLKSKNAKSKFLFPYGYQSGPHKGKMHYWNSGLWSKLKRRIQKRSGVNFSWKDYRSTCVDIDKNIYNMGIEDISRKLGHTTIVTTESFYGRLRMGKARERRVACLTEAKREGSLAIIAMSNGKVKNQNGPSDSRSGIALVKSQNGPKEI